MKWMNCAKAGFGKKSLKIKFPVNLSGFAGNRVAEKFRDPLYVKVLVWEISNIRYLWINYDLIAIDELILKQIYANVLIPKERIFVSATHTHSGVGGCLKTDEGVFNGYEYIFCKKNTEVITSVVKDTLDAIEMALKDIDFVSISSYSGEIKDICSNRNDKNFSGDDNLLALEIIQKTGKKILIYNFACHPTILNQLNLEVSADFPGEINKMFIEDGYYYAMFINGSAGDISTRFTRKSTGITELNRISTLIYKQINTVDFRSVKNIELGVKNFVVNLKVKDKTKLEDAIKKVELAKSEVELHKNTNENIRIYESRYEGAIANYHYSKYFPEDIEKIAVNIQIWKINQSFIVCIPGELFSELSNLIKKENIYFASYSNGYLGYFSDKKGYKNNVYEALSSPFDIGQGEYMMDCIKEKISTM